MKSSREEFVKVRAPRKRGWVWHRLNRSGLRTRCNLVLGWFGSMGSTVYAVKMSKSTPHPSCTHTDCRI